MTRLQATKSWVRIPAGTRNFASDLSQKLWGPTGLSFSGYRSSLPGLKRPRRDIDDLSPPSVEVRYEWSFTSIFLPIWVQVLETTIFPCVGICLHFCKWEEFYGRKFWGEQKDTIASLM